MELTIKNRIILMGALPRFDSMNNIVLALSIKGKLQLSEIEQNGIVTKQLSDGVTEIGFKDGVNPAVSQTFTLTDEELFYLKQRVRMIDINGMVSADSIDTYQKVFDGEFSDELYSTKWDNLINPNPQINS